MSNKDYLEIIYWAISVFILLATVYYIKTGPVNAAKQAVEIGRNLNNAQQKDNAKRSLFLLLFALRGSPAHYDFVRGLNQIAVVYEDVPKVLEAWRSHLKDLNNKNGLADPVKTWEIGRVQLLSEMSTHLGYKSIAQTDILTDYFPEGHGNQLKDEFEFREANLKYYVSGAKLQELLYNLNSPPPPEDQK